jgi:hypothetical protein
MLKSEDANITLLSAADFIQSYQIPRFVIKGLLQSGFVTALTAQIGHGKTALLSYMAFCVALGLDFGGHKTTKGRVIYVAAENDQDVIQRFAAQAQALGLPKLPEGLEVMVLQNSHDFFKSMDGLAIEVTCKNVDLVIIDTATAVFNGTDENDNVQQKDFGSKVRNLIKQFPGNPAIVIACHPPKSSTEKSSLKPRGGSALYGEIDCGLTLVRKDKILTLEAAEKFRGQTFKPLSFRLSNIKCDRIQDSEGLPINSVAILSDTVESPDAKTYAEAAVYSDPQLAEGIVYAIKTLKNAKFSEIMKETIKNGTFKSETDQIDIKKAVRATLGELTASSRIMLKGKTYFMPIENK